MQKQMGAAEPAAEIAVQCSRHLIRRVVKRTLKEDNSLFMLEVYCFLFFLKLKLCKALEQATESNIGEPTGAGSPQLSVDVLFHMISDATLQPEPI